MSKNSCKYYWRSMISIDKLIIDGEVELGRGNIISKEDIHNVPGQFPIYSSSSKSLGMMGRYGNYMFDEEMITWSVDGGGYLFYRPKHKFSVTNVCGFMRLSKNWDYRFVSYMLQFQHGYMSFDYQSKAHPSVIRHIYQLPNIVKSAQKSIAEILCTIDTQIDDFQALIDKYTLIKQGMMADLFSRGIDTSTGQLRPTFEEAPELYHETELGWLPKGWSTPILESLLADVNTPMRSGPFGSALLKHELVNEGIPLLGIDNIFVEEFRSSYKRFVTAKKFQDLSRYAVKPKDVVITIMGTVGRTCVVPDNVGRALSSKHLWTMTFDQARIIPELVCWQLNHSEWVDSWFRKESQGGVMEAIQSQTLRQLRLVLPPEGEQKKIHEIYSTLNDQVDISRRELAKLKLQKQGLMQDLLTGKVSVA